jgi:hypothetical protein
MLFVLPETWNSLVTRLKTKLDRLAEPMQKIKRVTQMGQPSIPCDGLGEDYQRKRKVRAVIVSIKVLGFPGRDA